MSTTIKLQESSVLQNFSLQCQSNSLLVSAEEAEWFVKILFEGMTRFLNIAKNKNNATAVAVSDLKGNMIMAAVVDYIEGTEDETATGNWTYYYTFDAAEIPENCTVHQITSTQVIEVIAQAGFDMVKLTMLSNNFYHQLSMYLMNIIKDVLDQNAPTTEGEDWTIELEGYFDASVSIEDGKKCMSLTPKGELKTKIKDDTASEK